MKGIRLLIILVFWLQASISLMAQDPSEKVMNIPITLKVSNRFFLPKLIGFCLIDSISNVKLSSYYIISYLRVQYNNPARIVEVGVSPSGLTYIFDSHPISYFLDLKGIEIEVHKVKFDGKYGWGLTYDELHYFIEVRYIEKDMTFRSSFYSVGRKSWPKELGRALRKEKAIERKSKDVYKSFKTEFMSN